MWPELGPRIAIRYIRLSEHLFKKLKQKFALEAQPYLKWFFKKDCGKWIPLVHSRV
jgi:hypothetical protein